MRQIMANSLVWLNNAWGLFCFFVMSEMESGDVLIWWGWSLWRDASVYGWLWV